MLQVVFGICVHKRGHIGNSTNDGGSIKERPVTPADLAATIYRHMDVPLDGTYLDDRGRPRYFVEENGQPLSELF